MTTHYQVMMYARLKPRTKWTGGRITTIDTVTLDDAARFASKHAGVEITPADFLRAAARGEILLRACCPRTVTMRPCSETDEPLPIVENSLPTLPLAACKALSNGRPAQWRTYEEIKVMDTLIGKERCRFTRWELPENEPDLLTTVADCRVTGHDVHALADAYIETPEQTTATTAPTGAVSSGDEDAEWKEKARGVACEIIARDRAKSLYPSQINIADEIAKKFRQDGVVGAEGKPLTGSYIKRHALTGLSSAQGKQLSTPIRWGK